MDGYNLIAPFYQFFVKLVFGDLLFKAQTHFLSKDLNPTQILIVGGGTGELLSFCLNQYPTAIITYVDSSEKMIELSKKGVLDQDKARVVFQCKSIFDWRSELQFDLVILPFVLDLLTNEKCLELLHKIKHVFSKNGILIVTDFFKNKSMPQNALVSFMYTLFRAVNASDRSSLPELSYFFSSQSFCIKNEQKLGKGVYNEIVVCYQLALCKTI